MEKTGILPKILIAIALGIACSFFFPGWAVRVFLTFNSIFGNFLGMFIPLLIIGLGPRVLPIWARVQANCC